MVCMLSQNRCTMSQLFSSPSPHFPRFQTSKSMAMAQFTACWRIQISRSFWGENHSVNSHGSSLTPHVVEGGCSSGTFVRSDDITCQNNSNLRGTTSWHNLHLKLFCAFLTKNSRLHFGWLEIFHGCSLCFTTLCKSEVSTAEST